MQWTEKEFANIINKGKKAIAGEIVPNLDNPLNEDIFYLENFAYLWSILGAVNLEGMTTETHHKIWRVLKQTNALDAHDKGMLLSFTKTIAEDNQNIPQKYWLDLDSYDIRVKFSQEILWEILKNNEDLTKEVAPYCLDGVRLVESLVDRELIPQVESYLDQLREQGASCGISGEGIRTTYEKEAVLRKVCSIVTTLKRKLAFDEKEYLFNYFHEVYLDGYDATHIGLDDEMLSRLMVDDEIAEVSELEAQKYLDHNWEVANFSKELDKFYGFCEQTASKLIRQDTSHLTTMVERCLSRIEIDEKPRGVIFALELVNLNQMKTAVNILIELSKKGRATEMICFLHRLLPRATGAESVIMKILRLNLQHLHLDEVIAGNSSLKEYVLRTYLNATEAFIEADYTKGGAELLQELSNEGWFLGSRNLVYTKFIELANKIIARDANQIPVLSAVAKKLKLPIYTKENIVSIGKEFEISPELSQVIQTSPSEKEEVISFDNDIEEDIFANTDDKQEKTEIEEILPEEKTAEETVEFTENITPVETIETEEPIIEETEEPVQANEQPENKKDEDAFQEILNQFNQPLPENEDNQEVSENIEDEFTKIIEGIQIKETDDNISEEQVSIVVEENKEAEEETSDNKINLNSILNISQKDIDKHFDKIKNITDKASKKAEMIIEKMEDIDLSRSKSIEKIKDIAKKISAFKWKK